MANFICPSGRGEMTLEERSRITEGDLKLFPQLTVNEGITCRYLGCTVMLVASTLLYRIKLSGENR